MMSVAKGVTSLAVHRLAGDGVLDIDRTIAAYWPAFGANGKQTITLRQVLAHTAGVPYCEGVSRGGLYDWQRMTDAQQVPAFAPGTVRCYHSATRGFIAGEVVRRVTGRSIGAMVADLCAPLDVDYRIGLDAAAAAQCDAARGTWL